jgi:hypothetical protein
MLTVTQIGGFVGAGLAGAAYLPQISHLIRARCSAGISRLAFGVWLLASVLVTARAVAIGAGVFIALGGIQIVATAMIMACAARYQSTPCPVHRPSQPPANDEVSAKAAIVVVDCEPDSRETLRRELSRRYGADYQILACGRPGELTAWMQDLRTAGLPVALVIGGVSGQDRDGIEMFAAVRRIDPTALRVAAVRWGDWESVRSVFDAVVVGTVDHWVTRPVQTPDEEFHRLVSEFLKEWSSQRGGDFEPVQVIGEQWSARSQELRDLFSRHRIPAGFYDAASGPGRRMLAELGVASGELPVVVLRFAPERPALVNPSNAEIADAFGVMTPIGPGRSSTWRWSGPARPGWPPRWARPPRACGRW